MADLPTTSGKNDTGEYDRFRDFMTRLVAVPHSEIKAQLDAEKKAKRKAKSRSAFRDSDASPKKPA